MYLLPRRIPFSWNNIRAALDVAANVCLVMVALFVGNGIFHSALSDERPATTAVRKPTALRALENQSGSGYAVALSPRCGYCEKALPHLQRLRSFSRNNAELFVVLVPRGTAPQRYQSELQPDYLIETDFIANGIPATPALFRIGPNGVVEAQILGVPTASQMDQWTARVSSNTRQGE
jgi:hypothetical protein